MAGRRTCLLRLREASAKQGRQAGISSSFCSLSAAGPGLTFTIKLLWLSSTLVILFGCGSALDDFQIPPHRQAVAVGRNFIDTTLKQENDYN